MHTRTDAHTPDLSDTSCGASPAKPLHLTLPYQPPRSQPSTLLAHVLPPSAAPLVYRLASVAVREPKRNSYTFKSQTTGSVFGASSNEPPDNVQSIQSAILNRHWTSKGSAFSTRERFPRVRAKWKD